MAGIFTIPDGFTLRGKIEAIPGLMREVRFDYRPAAYKARCKLNAAFTAEQKELAGVEVVCEHTANWRIVNDDGTIDNVAINADILRGVPAVVVETARAFVMGDVGPVLEAEAGK